MKAIGIPTTENFTRTDTQEMANMLGKPFMIFLHEGIWHSWQKGLKEIPEGATRIEEIQPN